MCEEKNLIMKNLQHLKARINFFLRCFLIKIKLDSKESIVNKNNYDLVIFRKYTISFNVHCSKAQMLVFFVNNKKPS